MVTHSTRVNLDSCKSVWRESFARIRFSSNFYPLVRGWLVGWLVITRYLVWLVINHDANLLLRLDWVMLRSLLDEMSRGVLCWGKWFASIRLSGLYIYTRKVAINGECCKFSRIYFCNSQYPYSIIKQTQKAHIFRNKS